jgi:hypothetical protein
VRHIDSIGAVLLALLTLGAIAATTAQAEEAPYWSIEGTRLAAGKTAEVTAKAVGNKTLTAGVVTITCTGGSLKPGAVIIGSNAGEPGKTEGVIELSGCTQTGNGSPCEVPSGKITTEPLTGELAYAENKKSLVGVAVPKKGKRLVALHFTGSGCLVPEAAIDGWVVGGIFTDVAGQAGVLLELPNSVAQAKSFIGKSTGTSKSNIWLIKAGTGSAVTTEELTYNGTEATLSGESLGLLSTNGVSNEKLWCPLL